MIEGILHQLKAYKKKYYLNILIRGVLLTLTLLLSAYILVSTLEYYGNFNTVVRALLFFTFLFSSLFILVKWIIIPLLSLLNLNKQLSDEEAARQIGRYFPEIKDKLINTLQLSRNPSEANALIKASIAQKTKEITIVPFTKAVNLTENKRYVRYAIAPAAILIAIFVFVPQLFTESTPRLIHYSTKYIPKAPFNFVLTNKSLRAYKNEDFEVRLQIEGNSVPEQTYILLNGRKHKMERNGDSFTFLIKNIQKSMDFEFEAGGFVSDVYQLETVSRPNLLGFEIKLNYPAYVRKKNESFSNVGNFTIPAGTVVTWHFDSEAADSLFVHTQSDKQVLTAKVSGTGFDLTKKLLLSTAYKLRLKNDYTENKEEIRYEIDVIPDQYPQISLEQHKDTSLFNYLVMGGNINDDYGLTKLQLLYKVLRGKSQKSQERYKSINLKIDAGQTSQSYIYNWSLDSLQLQPDDALEYYVAVWDNDGVNGPKIAKTKTYTFKIPSSTALAKEINSASEMVEKSIDKSLAKAQEVERDLKKIKEKLRGKRNVDWQDKKLIEDLLKKQQELKQEIEQLQKDNMLNNEKRELLTGPNEEISKKVESLQKLINELLDDETKRLYEQLEKLLEQKSSSDMMQHMLENIDKKDKTITKELDRALELFKQLKFEQKLEQTIQQLEKTAQEQQKLSEQTEKSKNDKNNELKLQQKSLKEQFEDIKQEMQNLKELNESLSEKNDLEQTDKLEEQIDQEQQNSSEQLDKNQKNKASQSQQKAAQAMKKMAKQLADSKQEMENEQNEENINDLRNILENLLTLSFEQEDLMKDFRKVSQIDPRYITLSQKQLKLKEDAVVIEDSLLALAKRVFQIQSFVTREVGAMKSYMDESMGAIKQRRHDIATGKQQLAMTSMNNLALLLSDILKQMQQDMMNAQSGDGKKSKKKKPGQGQGNLGKLQQQLNQKIEDLKKSGMSGQALSEELAKLAAQQEMIRRAMQEMEQKSGNGKSGNLDNIKNQMEKTEQDLVNKKITQETILRQKEIMTRLLEAEKAMKEREQDEKRESNTAKEINRGVPPSFDQYIKTKEKQVELLKTLSPSLSSFYKQESNKYFQMINK